MDACRLRSKCGAEAHEYSLRRSLLVIQSIPCTYTGDSALGLTGTVSTNDVRRPTVATLGSALSLHRRRFIVLLHGCDTLEPFLRITALMRMRIFVCGLKKFMSSVSPGKYLVRSKGRKGHAKLCDVSRDRRKSKQYVRILNYRKF